LEIESQSGHQVLFSLFLIRYVSVKVTVSSGFSAETVTQSVCDELVTDLHYYFFTLV